MPSKVLIVDDDKTTRAGLAELLEAATHWRYRPAQRNGKPVASNKRVDVVLRPRE